MTAVSRRLSLPILAAGFACGLLLSPLDAVAATSPKACAAIARKAKSRLAQSLAACGRKDVTAEIGQCGADQWKKYVDRLADRGCKASARARRIKRPMLARIQAADSADDLAAADIEAREAHLALRRLLERLVQGAAAQRGKIVSFAKIQGLAGELEDAIARVDEAETALAAVESAIWHGFSGDPSLSWLIDEPLRVAMQQTQIEFRRLLGPEWPTEIAALREDPGCHGDLIGDRMIAAYGDAVLEGGKDRTPEAAALGRIAAQLACMSVRQTGLVDVAVSVAADRVEQLLGEAGLARLRDDYARLLAPVQVLVLDTVKIAGDHAYAWHWFLERHDPLKNIVDRLGWATSRVVWLYDRIDGRMIGFPPCENGELPGRCVDVGTFLDSLVDPRALGFGDCALSGMVAGGLKHGGGVNRYACPSTDCGTTSGGKGAPTSGRAPKPVGATGGISDFLGGANGSSSNIPNGQLPWSGLSSNDASVMRSFGCSSGSGGGGSGGGGSQGPGGSLGDWSSEEECVQEALAAPRDPYVAFTRCVADVVGDHQALTLDLAGVPAGPACRPSVSTEPFNGSTPPSGGSTTTTAAPANATTTTVATTDSTTTTEAPAASVPCIATGPLDFIAKLFECGIPTFEKAATGKVLRPSAEGGVVGVEIELLKPENAQIFYDTGGGIMGNRIQQNCDGGFLSEEICAKLATMKPGEQAEYLRATGHLNDCADPEQCDSECTTLGAQVMERMKDCQQQLNDALAPAPSGQNAPGTRVNPDPDGVTGGLPDDPLLACLLSDADGGSSGMDLGCALVQCSGTDAAIGKGSACCGDATPTIGVSVVRIISEKTCQSIHCGDGDAVVADSLGDCGCGSGAPITGGPGPQPSPEGPRSPGR